MSSIDRKVLAIHIVGFIINSMIIQCKLDKENINKIIESFMDAFNTAPIGLYVSDIAGHELGIAPACYVANIELVHGQIGIIQVRDDGMYHIIILHELGHALNHWLNQCGIMDRNKGHDKAFMVCLKMVETWYYRMVERG